MKAATSPRRRQAARRFARVRSRTGVGCAVTALTSRSLAGLGLLQLRVDLLVGALEPAGEILLAVGDREGRGAVLQVRRLLLDEVDPPLAVHVHRDLARLEGVRG